MSIDSPQPQTFGDLWEGATDIEWERIKVRIRANRLNEIATFGVDVSDPIALEAAYNDRDLMCTLAGREMRAGMAAMDAAHPGRKSSGLAREMGFAEALYEARLKAKEDPRPLREMLL